MSKAIAMVLLFLSFPIQILLFFSVKLSSPGPFLFKQKRLGKGKQKFILYKLRTMISEAENLKEKYAHLNEASRPVFKIKNDPRYTRVGKVISHLGLDELPQLLNIIKGEMVFVGPRPLPTDEAEKIPEKYKDRFLVLPGITSLWVIKGGHSLTFDEWMELDLYYVAHRSLWLDCYIVLQTFLLFIKVMINILIFQYKVISKSKNLQ